MSAYTCIHNTGFYSELCVRVYKLKVSVTLFQIMYVHAFSKNKIQTLSYLKVYLKPRVIWLEVRWQSLFLFRVRVSHVCPCSQISNFCFWLESPLSLVPAISSLPHCQPTTATMCINIMTISVIITNNTMTFICSIKITCLYD